MDDAAIFIDLPGIDSALVAEITAVEPLDGDDATCVTLILHRAPAAPTVIRRPLGFRPD